jgi:hypothetical protein
LTKKEKVPTWGKADSASGNIPHTIKVLEDTTSKGVSAQCVNECLTKGGIVPERTNVQLAAGNSKVKWLSRLGGEGEVESCGKVGNLVAGNSVCAEIAMRLDVWRNHPINSLLKELLI